MLYNIALAVQQTFTPGTMEGILAAHTHCLRPLCLGIFIGSFVMLREGPRPKYKGYSSCSGDIL